MVLRRVLVFMAVAVSLCGLAAHPARAEMPVAVAHAGWPQDRSDLPYDKDARYGILPNGLRYVIYRNTAKARATAIRFQIAAGSMQESDQQRGLAHFVEHMAFNGSTNIAEGELPKILAREGFQFGSDVNAFTDYEKTDFVLNLPSNDEEPIETALFILREIAGNLTFAPDAVERERGVVLSEERMRASPSGRSEQAFIAAAYPGQLYPARNPIGLIDTIKTAPREQLVKYYHDFYRPDNAILVIAGDFDMDGMERRIAKTFGDWQTFAPGPLKAADYGTRTSKDVTASVYSEKSLFDTETVTWFRPFITTADSRASRLRGMAKYMVTQIINTRFARLAEDPQSPYLSAQLVYDNQQLQDNTTVLTVIPKPGQQQQALSAALKSLFQFRELGADPGEVSDFITQGDIQNANLLRASKTRFSDDIANEIMLDIDEDGVFQSAQQYVDLWNDMKPGLTLDLVDSQAKAILDGDGPVLFRQGSDESGFDAAAMKAAYAEAVAAHQDAWARVDGKAWPYTDFGPQQKPVSKAKIDKLDYMHYVFANGVTANVKSSPLIKNQIIVSVRFGGGFLLFSPAEKISLLQTGLYDPTDGGLNKISRSDMAKAMANKQVSVDFDLQADHASLTGYTTLDSYETEMQLLAAYATDAAFGADAFANFKSSLGYMYTNMQSSPQTVVAMNQSQYLTSGDPRYVFPTQADAENIDNDDLAAIYHRLMTDVPIEITVTGDISQDTALKQIGKTFANLPAVPADYKIAPGADQVSVPADRTPQVWYHQGRDDQAVELVAFPTTDALGDLPTTRGLAILAAVLNDRLEEDFREQQGASYDISAQSYGAEAFKGYGYLTVECTLRPDMDEAFIDAVTRAVTDLAQHGVTTDELNRARNPLLEGMNDDVKNNEDWQSTLAGLYGHPERWSYEVDIARQYLNVSTGDIQRLAATYLKPEAMLRMKAIPAPKP